MITNTHTSTSRRATGAVAALILAVGPAFAGITLDNNIRLFPPDEAVINDHFGRFIAAGSLADGTPYIVATARGGYFIFDMSGQSASVRHPDAVLDTDLCRISGSYSRGPVITADLTNDGSDDVIWLGGDGDGEVSDQHVCIVTMPEARPEEPAGWAPDTGLRIQAANKWFEHVGEFDVSRGRFGIPITAGDFNGDQQLDLAVGAAWVDGGYVTIFEFGPNLTYEREEISQDSEGIAGKREVADWFGWALTSHDYDDDEFDDLVVGVPGEDLSGGTEIDVGMINVIYGSETGLTAADNRAIHQNTSGIPGTAEYYDTFGYALASGDFDDDGYGDVAIGVPDEDIADSGWLGIPTQRHDAGMIVVIYGSADGLQSRAQGWHQGSSGIRGELNRFDYFGEVLAAGDFDLDGVDDLAVAAPHESTGLTAQHGAVHLLYGKKYVGLTNQGDEYFVQASGIYSSQESGDRFGLALASALVDRSRPALVIGVPAEQHGENDAPFPYSDQDGMAHVLLSDISGNQNPIAEAGDDQLIYLSDACDTEVTLDAGASTDPDGHSLTYRWFIDEDSYDSMAITVTLPVGVHEAQLDVSDGLGGTDHDTVKVSIAEYPPTIKCPADVTSEATSAMSTLVELGQPTMTGGLCSAVEVMNDAPDAFPLGDTPVTWTVRDTEDVYDPATGEVTRHEDGCVQTVEVVDTTAPVVSAPPDKKVREYRRAQFAELGMATATDAVGVVEIYNDAPFMFPPGETIVTWYAIDAAGNVGSDTQTVTGFGLGSGSTGLIWLVALFLVGIRRKVLR